jgi:hypothetical protein
MSTLSSIPAEAVVKFGVDPWKLQEEIGRARNIAMGVRTASESVPWGSAALIHWHLSGLPRQESEREARPTTLDALARD